MVYDDYGFDEEKLEPEVTEHDSGSIGSQLNPEEIALGDFNELDCPWEDDS